MRIVEPASALCNRYVVLFDPMDRQLLPPVSQRLHSYTNEVGVCVHEPFVVLRTLSTFSVPETTGGAVLAGAMPLATTPVAEETPLPEPSELLAFTDTRSRCPTSSF